MKTYIENQLYRVCPIPPEKMEFPVKVQFSSEHGKTNHINLTAEQFCAIERILTGE